MKPTNITYHPSPMHVKLMPLIIINSNFISILIIGNNFTPLVDISTLAPRYLQRISLLMQRCLNGWTTKPQPNWSDNSNWCLLFSGIYIYRADLKLSIMNHPQWKPHDPETPPIFELFTADLIGSDKKTKQINIQPWIIYWNRRCHCHQWPYWPQWWDHSKKWW